VQDALGIVPPEIRAKYEREEWVERGVRAGRALERALKDMDPALDVVFIKPDIGEEYLPGGAIPGYWHVRRNNPAPAVPTYMPITTEDGGFRQPDFGVIDELRRSDLWAPGALEKALRQEDRTRAKELAKEQRLDELKSDFRAARRVSGEGGLHKRFRPRKKP
jgi:hypothetical protein